MADFAYDPRTIPAPRPPLSEVRLRVPPRYASELADEIERFSATARDDDDRDVVSFFLGVAIAARDLEELVLDLGATHVTKPWLHAASEWFAAVTSTLGAAFGYAGEERAVALALAAEESSMRLTTRLEREANDTVNVLKNLDRNAAHAAGELAAAIEIADRRLRRLAG